MRERINRIKKWNNLKPDYIYSHNNYSVCYLGYLLDSNWPCLCLIFENNKNNVFEFIEWSYWMKDELVPMNISIEDYIIKNNIVWKTIKSFNNPKFSSGGCKEAKNKIRTLKNKLLKNEILVAKMNEEIKEYKLEKAAKKYSL